jgi:hypothetical protein
VLKLKHTKRSSFDSPSKFISQANCTSKRTREHHLEIHQVELSACRRRIEDNYEKNQKDGQRDIWCGGKNGGGPFSYGISLVP